MSIATTIEKIDTLSNVRKSVIDEIAIEEPINIFINDEYVITLLATPELKKELVLGWLFDEGVLERLDQIDQIIEQQDIVEVHTKQSIEESRLRAVSVSRLLTTACGLSARKFFDLMSGGDLKPVDSDYHLRAESIIKMVHRIDEGRLFQSTGGVHVAALFEEGQLAAFAEDVGRHNAVDKVVGKAILANVDFSKSVLVSSGRQPADMVLKAARMGIPVVVSKAAPIRSGIIAAEKTGITLACFVRNHRMNLYTHLSRVLT